MPERLDSVFARMTQDPAFRARLEENDREVRAERELEEKRERCSRRAKALVGVPLRQPIERALVIGEPLTPTKALQAVQRWCASDDRPPILVIAGATGSGKTVAAAWALSEAAAAPRHSSRWLSATGLNQLWLQQYDRDALAQQEHVRRCKLLILDDVGREPDAVRMGATLLELLDERQHSARRFRTVLTTNLNRKAFEARYPDQRLASRIADAAVVAWVATAEGDMRRTTK